MSQTTTKVDRSILGARFLALAGLVHALLDEDPGTMSHDTSCTKSFMLSRCVETTTPSSRPPGTTPMSHVAPAPFLTPHVASRLSALQACCEFCRTGSRAVYGGPNTLVGPTCPICLLVDTSAAFLFYNGALSGSNQP